MPGVLLLVVITPVAEFRVRPLGVAENVPPAVPVTLGVALLPVWQKLLPEYANVAVVCGVMVIDWVAVTAAQPLLAGRVLVTV